MFSKKFIISQFIIIILFVSLGALYYFSSHVKLDVLGSISDFELSDSRGQSVALKDLLGKIWVADFMFTTCSDICPMMTKNMQTLYQQFRGQDSVRFVSVSVNPENDSPEVLQKYAQKFGVDNDQWLFLTGNREVIQNLVAGSFKLGDIKEPVFHSSYFALVDARGNIRGYYDGLDAKAIQKLVKNIRALQKE